MTKVGNHGFRATAITACLKNCGTLEKAAAIASTPARVRRNSTTDDEISLDDVERIEAVSPTEIGRQASCADRDVSTSTNYDNKGYLRAGICRRDRIATYTAH
jgi:hypothetical protein